MAPGSPVTFSGTATDDEGLHDVTITLENDSTGEELAADGTWGTNVQGGNHRISPLDIGGTSYNWSYTTPFNLTSGTYSFSVRASDDLGLTTSSNNQGRLTINVQVPGDAFPNATISPDRHAERGPGPAPEPDRYRDRRHRRLGGPGEDRGAGHAAGTSSPTARCPAPSPSSTPP